jgi:ATP-dependent Clp protease protease subunit
MANMMQKLNLDFLKDGDKSTHGFYLLMEEVSLNSIKPLVEWILEANFQPERPELLNLLICSPGGDLNAAFAAIDTMRGSAIPIRTIGLGQIASAGLLIFASGTKGQRILTPNTSILSHQYSWGAFGKEHELFATVKEFDLTTKRMITHYKKCTGLTEAQIRDHLLPPQDIWLSAEESKKLGLCDAVKDLK